MLNEIIVIAHIRNNETGEIRDYEAGRFVNIDDLSYLVFNWEENNYSCDCNRHIFFNIVNGIEAEFNPCSDGKYSVNLSNKKTGEIYYQEY